MYGSDGRYLGEIKNGKLITSLSSHEATGAAALHPMLHASGMFLTSIT